MEREYNIPYKSNYTLGIIYTIAALLTTVISIVSLIVPTIGCIGSIISLVSAVLLMVWFYKSHKNLASFNNQGIKYSPGWAVGAFFVPVLNLFRPYQITQEIWKGSDPEASTVGWKQSENGVIIIIWWGVYIINIIVSMVMMGYGISSGVQAGLNGTQIDPTMLQSFTMPAMVLGAISTILTISMVVMLNDRQDEKAEKLGLLR